MGDAGDRKKSVRDIGLEQRLNRLRVKPPHLDWFFLNPIIKGYIKYNQLFDGSITIYDLFLLNHLIEYIDEYDIAIKQYYEEKIEREKRSRNGR